MIGLKVTAILFVSIVLCSSSNERQTDAQDRIDRILKPPEKTVLQRSLPYVKRSLNENSSFFSKLAGWLNPFSTSSSKEQDLSTQEIRHAPPQYLPPPPQPIHQISHGHSREACNPCNKEPWIPVASTYGKETIIGFIQPSDIGFHGPHIKNGAPSIPEFLHPPPAKENHFPNSLPQLQYDLPNISNLDSNLTPPKEYGLPKEYISPPSKEYGHLPSEYGPPTLEVHHVDVSHNQPIGQNSQNLGHPNQNIGPPFQEHNPPFIYLPPQEYGLPNNFVSPPKQEYGTPSVNIPLQHLGPPPKTQGNYPPKIYGPPEIYGTPKPDYGLPKHIKLQHSNDQFGVPNKPVETKYLPPINFRPPTPGPNYNFAPPIPPNAQEAQFANYRPKFGPPRFRPRQKANTSNKYTPTILPDERLPLDMRPPPLHGFISNYGGISQPNIQNDFPTLSSGVPSVLPPLRLQTLPSVLPSDSYGAPVTGTDVDYGLAASSSGGRHYLPPLNVLPLVPNRNSDIQISPSIQIPIFDEILLPQKPVALPNLSQYPIVPIYNAKIFRKNHENNGNTQSTYSNIEIKGIKTTEISQERTTESIKQTTNIQQKNSQNDNNKNVQIIPSVPVISFLSSIEHPINLIQAPLVELTTNFSDSYRQTESENLSENPIVVQHGGDSHASATAQNATYQNSIHDYKQRNNDKSLVSENIISIEKVVSDKEFLNILLSGSNNTISALTDFKLSGNLNQNPKGFTVPTLDYSDWSPALNTIPTSMIPPPIGGESVWLTTTGVVGEQITTTTNKPKRIQIIIPYTTKNKPAPFEDIYTKQPDLFKNQARKTPFYSESHEFDPQLSFYTQPPSSESVWLQHMNDYNTDESREVTGKTYTDTTKSVINIKDLLKMEVDKKYYQNLPYDIITLQKNIDGWTEQEYSQKVNRGLTDYQKVSTAAQLIPSKKIPDTYLTTNSINVTETTTPRQTLEFYDHEPAGSNSKESKFKDFENNFILTDVTTIPGTSETIAGTTELPESTKPAWDTKQVTISALTQEKVYVVTPETSLQSSTTPSTIAFSHPPKIGTKSVVTNAPSIVFSSPALGISLKPGQDVKSDLDDNVRIIFSEWPHLINKLATTTTEKPLTRHPLFGLMDLTSYVPPANASIETYSGHSKVITIVTPVSVSKNKTSGP